MYLILPLFIFQRSITIDLSQLLGFQILLLGAFLKKKKNEHLTNSIIPYKQVAILTQFHFSYFFLWVGLFHVYYKSVAK